MMKQTQSLIALTICGLLLCRAWTSAREMGVIVGQWDNDKTLVIMVSGFSNYKPTSNPPYDHQSNPPHIKSSSGPEWFHLCGHTPMFTASKLAMIAKAKTKDTTSTHI